MTQSLTQASALHDGAIASVFAAVFESETLQAATKNAPAKKVPAKKVPVKKVPSPPKKTVVGCTITPQKGCPGPLGTTDGQECVGTILANRCRSIAPRAGCAPKKGGKKTAQAMAGWQMPAHDLHV